ncbi:MAG: HNH endonuclease, partial [Candidatus Brocadia sp.]
VMRNDNFKCRICGRSPATDQNIKLEVDHVKPWSKGGETVIENLQTLCSDCNSGKSNLRMK